MPSILIQLDEPTLAAMDRHAPPAKRQRAEFVRKAIRDAIYKLDCLRMREAYRLQPDSAEGADTWEDAEEWNP